MQTIFRFLLVLTLLMGAVSASEAAQVISAGEGKSLELAVSHGRLVRLRTPAAAVFVADPTVADIQIKSPRMIYLTALKPGRTTLYAVDAKERILLNKPVHVTHDLSAVQRSIAQLHPGLDVKVASVNDSIMLHGMVPDASTSESLRKIAVSFTGDETKVINRTAVIAPNQINLRVRIAEVSRDVDKQLGINWSALGNIGKMTFGLTTVNPFKSFAGGNALNLGYSGGWSLTSVIDALEQEGLISVLAEPNLTAMTGQTASFLAGGEFPVITGQDDDGMAVSYKQFGVSLAFTPTVLDGNRINLHVRPEVSQLTSVGAVNVVVAGGSIQVPALSTRRAETTVELGSGQSFAIAGLLQNNVSHDVDKFPGLGDVPVLGRLFRSDRFQRNESELVIIVTPYLVRPVQGRQLALPNDGLRSPNDYERLTVGATHRRQRRVPQPVRSGPGGSELVGRVGFMME